jgi:hypothetical protein
MKSVMLMLVMLFVVSCEKPQKPSFVCQAAKIATDTLAIQIANKWDCDFNKVSMFIYKPIEEKFCSREKSMASMACNLVIDMITSMGAEKIASEFSCNKQKVIYDLQNANKLCEVLTK